MLRPLGLPVGSVRALLLLSLGVRAILDLRSHHTIEPWLAVALILSAAAYFSARSSSRAGIAGTATGQAGAPRIRHPLFLPAGTIRTIVLILVAYGAWLWYRNHDVSLGGVPVAWILGAFAFGVVLRWLLSRARRPEDQGTGFFWHLEALIALACAGGLVAMGFGATSADFPAWTEPLLASAVVFYFGTR